MRPHEELTGLGHLHAGELQYWDLGTVVLDVEALDQLSNSVD